MPILYPTKDLHSEYIKNSQNSFVKKKKPNLKNRQKNRHFTEDTHVANKHIKRCSTLVAIGEMHIKTSKRYRYLSIKMEKKKSQNKSPNN